MKRLDEQIEETRILFFLINFYFIFIKFTSTIVNSKKKIFLQKNDQKTNKQTNKQTKSYYKDNMHITCPNCFISKTTPLLFLFPLK